MAFKTSPCFVDSVWEVFGPLLAGAPLLVVPQEVARRPEEVSQGAPCPHLEVAAAACMHGCCSMLQSLGSLEAQLLWANWSATSRPTTAPAALPLSRHAAAAPASLPAGNPCGCGAHTLACAGWRHAEAA